MGLWCALALYPGLSAEQAHEIVARADSEVVKCLAFREFLPFETAIRLAGHPHEAVRTAAGFCVRMPVDCIAALANDKDPEVRIALAVMGAVPEAVARGLAADAHRGVRITLATNLNLAPAVRDRLARHEDADIRRAVASRLDLPPAVVSALAADRDPKVRATVAARPGLPAELRRRLAEDPAEGVRDSARVGEGTTLPFGLKPPLAHSEAMALDASPVRRAWVALNSELSRDLWRHLAADGDAGVRRALAFNPVADPRGLARLAADSDPLVRLVALGHPLLPEEALVVATAPPGCSEEIAHLLLGRGKLPTVILRRLAQHPNEEVREVVASLDAELPRDVFERLARDPSVWARRSLAWRRDMPAEWYDCLVGDDDVEVLEGLAGRGHPCRRQAEVRQRLEILIGAQSTLETRVEIAGRQNLTRDLIERLAKDAAQEVRAVIAGRPDVSSNRLRQLVKDPASCVRLAVATRSRLTPKVRQLLESDPDPAIRAAVVASAVKGSAMAAVASRS